MLNIRTSLRAFALFAFICALSSAATAQATRTWVSGANLDVKNTNIFKNRIGLLVGTGATVRLGSSIITQNSTNFTNNGSIASFCDNKTDTNPIPGAVSPNCLK